MRSNVRSVTEVILGLSGGVDSSVAAALIHQGDRRPADLRFLSTTVCCA